MPTPLRLGLVVPSSNTTMETEIPAMLRAREAVLPERFTTHASRVRMRQVTRAELAAMVSASERAVVELADAAVDAVGYACLVAIMAQGSGYHRTAEADLGRALATAGSTAPVVSSAGALLAGIAALGASKVAVVAPYEKELTASVVDYLEAEGIEVVDSASLEVSDNLEVGRIDGRSVVERVRSLSLGGADAVVLSACVQMPSLALVEPMQQELGLPVLTAATATVHQLLTSVGVAPVVPGAGALLAG